MIVDKSPDELAEFDAANPDPCSRAPKKEKMVLAKVEELMPSYGNRSAALDGVLIQLPNIVRSLNSDKRVLREADRISNSTPVLLGSVPRPPASGTPAFQIYAARLKQMLLDDGVNGDAAHRKIMAMPGLAGTDRAAYQKAFDSEIADGVGPVTAHKNVRDKNPELFQQDTGFPSNVAGFVGFAGGQATKVRNGSTTPGVGDINNRVVRGGLAAFDDLANRLGPSAVSNAAQVLANDCRAEGILASWWRTSLDLARLLELTGRGNATSKAYVRHVPRILAAYGESA